MPYLRLPQLFTDLRLLQFMLFLHLAKFFSLVSISSVTYIDVKWKSFIFGSKKGILLIKIKKKQVAQTLICCFRNTHVILLYQTGRGISKKKLYFPFPLLKKLKINGTYLKFAISAITFVMLQKTLYHRLLF